MTDRPRGTPVRRAWLPWPWGTIFAGVACAELAAAGEEPVVVEVIREVDASPEQVWAVLSDGWSYPGWVVGASRMRAVDPRWPEPGTKLHHSAGLWPVVLNDETEVRRSEPNRRLVLVARGRPIGEAVIDLEIEPRGTACTLRMREDAVSGPGRLVPRAVRQVVIGARNAETLRRLAYIAEGRATPTEGPGPDAGSPASLGKSKVESDDG